MSKSIDEILREPDDSELCGDVYSWILDHRGNSLDASKVTEAERVVVLTTHVRGIIDNGGFRYLFEGDLVGDPEYALTMEAFATIGCAKAVDAFRKTLAIFPDSRPPRDIDKRLRYYLKRIKRWPTDMDIQFFDASKEVDGLLAAYIRLNAEEFRRIRFRKPNKLRRKASEQSIESEGNKPLAEIPHWARVAFAAYCARLVYPLLTEGWPDIPAERTDGVRRAIDLAEMSAAEGRAIAGLKEAEMDAVGTAGAALMGETDEGDPAPKNLLDGTKASLTAKAAEKAAAAACAPPNESRELAADAWGFAFQVADESTRELFRETLHKFEKVAIRGNWTDRTRVPPEIWTML